jgi:hypothetical protein
LYADIKGENLCIVVKFTCIWLLRMQKHNFVFLERDQKSEKKS